MRTLRVKTADDYFAEGVEAREVGKHARDNPYCAGSDERREWHAGFMATVEHEDEDGISLDPNEDNEVRTDGL